MSSDTNGHRTTETIKRSMAVRGWRRWTGREQRMCSVASGVSDSATLWTVAFDAPLSMGFARQEYCCGLPFPIPGSSPGIESVAPALAGRFFTNVPPGKPTEDFYDLENTLYNILIGICHDVVVQSPSCVRLCDPSTAACQNYMSVLSKPIKWATLSVGALRQHMGFGWLWCVNVGSCLLKTYHPGEWYSQ